MRRFSSEKTSLQVMALHSKERNTMKKGIKRTISIAAAGFLLASAALASVLGELIDGHETFLGGGMELSKGVYWTGSDYRTENYIEYTPNSAVKPVVVSGSKLCNYGSFSSMAKLLENEGKHVIAGINGDYYVMANYEPLGIVVQDGELLSSDAGHYAVGFKSDGTAVFGKPGIELTATLGDAAIKLSAVNKTRNEGGVVLYTDNYAYKTKNSGEGMDLICTISAPLTMNGTVTLTVEEIRLDGGSVEIPEGKAVLSISASVYEETLALFNKLVRGDTIDVTISSPQEWAQVSYAIGSLYKLVTNGAVESGLDTTAAPRTAVGMKEDGSLVLYTMDGRKSGHSIGVSMKALAERMLELGCVEATIMDGGGSTSLNAIYLGDSSASQINSPSDGAQRSVTNYIMLVTEEKPTGLASRLALYPLSTHILSGASTGFTVKAADENGYATRVPEDTVLSADSGIGTVSADGSFTAGAAGSGTVYASANGLTGATVQVRVVETPDILRVYKQGTNKAVSSLEVMTNSVTDLMGQAMDNYVYLISQDNCYDWSVEGNIGSIDENGVFTAAGDKAEGSIIVSAGEKSVVIPVTVKQPGSYDDVRQGQWYYEAVEYVTEQGMMNGVGERVFSPEATMSRAMVVTVLHRLAGQPQAGESAPSFTDVPLDAWYSAAVSWAAETGVVQGYDNGCFYPDGAVTREQLATILYRYKASPETSGSLEAFADSAAVSSWALDAMRWSVEKGIVGGLSAQELAPASSATRAQVAAILQRLSNLE